MVSAADPRPGADRGLVWWSDTQPAIRRTRSGRGFRYVGPQGEAVAPRDVDRIRRLAIPPAWTDVRICPNANGYLQATGRDARGRKQYRYHPAWRSARENAKFRDLVAFGEALPAIRERVARDLQQPGMPREKVLALIVRLLDATHARVGNERYARENRSFGLTTLSNRHAAVEGREVRLRFRGKAGRFHELGVRDQRLATLVRRCRELPGRQLFEYLDDDGTVRSIRSEDVNDYLREAAGADVTAKMFRTWAATVLADRLLAAEDPPEAPPRIGRRSIKAAVDAVARRLGNTPAVARSAYIHPAVPEAYTRGDLHRSVQPADPSSGPAWTEADEAATLELLRRWATRPAGRRVRSPARKAAGRRVQRPARVA